MVWKPSAPPWELPEVVRKSSEDLGSINGHDTDYSVGPGPEYPLGHQKIAGGRRPPDRDETRAHLGEVPESRRAALRIFYMENMMRSKIDG